MNVSSNPCNLLITKNSRKSHSDYHYNDYDIQLAESIIHRLVPQDLHLGDLDIAIRYVMANHVGGDLAYVYPVDSTHTYMTICDVVGHGVASCLMVAYIHTQALMILQNKPDNIFDFIHQLNDVCYRVFQELTLFFTYAVVRYNHSDSTFQFATCGHPPIIVLKSDGMPTFLSTPCPFLGSFCSLDVEPDEKAHHLEPGDKIILYTDGISEAHNQLSNELFGKKRFIDLLLKNQPISNSELAELVVNEVKKFSGKEIHDDITFMVFSRPEKHACNGSIDQDANQSLSLSLGNFLIDSR